MDGFTPVRNEHTHQRMARASLSTREGFHLRGGARVAHHRPCLHVHANNACTIALNSHPPIRRSQQNHARIGPTMTKLPLLLLYLLSVRPYSLPSMCLQASIQ